MLRVDLVKGNVNEGAGQRKMKQPPLNSSSNQLLQLTIFFLGAKWLTVSDGNIRKTITVLQAVNHQSW